MTGYPAAILATLSLLPIHGFETVIAAPAADRGSIHEESRLGEKGEKGEATIERLKKAIASQVLLWELSIPDDVIACLGQPSSRKEEPEGGMVRLSLEYPGFTVLFSRFAESENPSPYTLVGYISGKEEVWVPSDYVVRLRTNEDLDRLNPFNGLQGVDLRSLDLRAERKRLLRFSYDTRTQWPPAERLPDDFDPAKKLEKACNPGLGIRALHAQGIDGSGVAIAVLDQPLLPDHDEYRHALKRVISIDVEGVPPQMHGPYVAGFAVGKTLGTAPKAELHYFATPMWKSTSVHFIRALDQILQYNTSTTNPIRVVSISTGMFPQYPDYPEWQKARERAETAGILVLTCTPEESFPLCMLTRRENGDPENPQEWERGIYCRKGGLMVPAGGRTHAGVAAKNCYVFDPVGGFSAVPPTLAGICALALQVNSRLTPAQIRHGLGQTAWRTADGLIVNPAALVEWAKGEISHIK